MATRRARSLSVPPQEVIDEVLKAKKKRAAERSKAYRDRKKNDSDYKQKEMERKRQYRLHMREASTEEERSRQRELNRKRQQRYNENKKRKLEDVDNIQPELATKKAKKALTRTEHKKMKLYWKEKKAVQRAKMTAQKKRRVCEIERLRYAKLKLSKTATFIASSPSPTPPSSTTSPPQHASSLSVSAKKQRAYRVKKVLPTSPKKFVQVMGHIIKNATPRKKTLLKTVGISSSPMKGKRLDYGNAIKETMTTLQGKRQVKRCLVISLKSIKKARNFKQIASETGIGYKFLRRYSNLSEMKDLDQLQRKKRHDCVDDETIAKVHDHFASSFSFVPDTKAVNKKTMESKKVMDEPVSKVYEKFKEKNPDIQLSQSKFSLILRGV